MQNEGEPEQAKQGEEQERQEVPTRKRAELAQERQEVEEEQVRQGAIQFKHCPESAKNPLVHAETQVPAYRRSGDEQVVQYEELLVRQVKH